MHDYWMILKFYIVCVTIFYVCLSIHSVLRRILLKPCKGWCEQITRTITFSQTHVFLKYSLQLWGLSFLVLYFVVMVYRSRFWLSSDGQKKLKYQNFQKRRPPAFFHNLHECLKIMVRSFRQDNKETFTSETLKRVEYLLKLHGMETRELIHQYHLERWQEQQSITDPKMGLLTIRAQFVEDNLKIEIMNARNLMPTDSNGA